MAIKQTGGTKLTGIHPLSYMGVEPVSPPQLVRFDRRPTNRDFGFNIGDLWLVPEPFEVWMLLEKPQNVAFWALIYPQAGGAGGISLIETDNGDVVADVNGAIGIKGGENINIDTAGPNTVIVNLNRFIEWPSTNAAGNEGVIYLDTESFIHNYGTIGNLSFNAFIGVLGGNFTLTGSNNTGCGYATLTHLTNGSDNTGIGNNALTNVSIGNNNIALGSNAGSNVVAQSDNIHIGSKGAAADGDAGVIRIGIETLQVQAFVAGITGVTVAGPVTPNTVLNVDDNGQIGQLELTSSGGTVEITQPSNGVINLEAIGGGGGGGNPFAFSLVQNGDSASIANGTDYPMGAFVALTKLFDVGNNITTGDGAGTEAVFTAPVTGKYYFEFYISFVGFPGTTACKPSIITTSRTYQSNAGAQGDGTTLGVFSVITDMAMGETARFTAKTPAFGGGATYIASGNGGALGIGNINQTRISGFLIPEGASGGNFSQPFLGIQQVDTANVVGLPTTIYLLGSAAPVVEIYDVGNNFDSGDGLGTPATYIAQATGIYVFTICFAVGGASNYEMGIGLNTPILNYFHNCGKFSVSGAREIAQRSFTCNLNIGQTVTFPVVAGSSLAISNDARVLAGFGGNTQIVFASTNVTFIYGYRIG